MGEAILLTSEISGFYFVALLLQDNGAELQEVSMASPL